jgi:hypothetical protein
LLAGDVLAEQIHAELDLRLLAELHDSLFQCLRQNPPVESGWIVESDLRHRVWVKWELWHRELRADAVKRRRFLLLLATERDEIAQLDEALVRLGPKIMRPHLLRAAIFALVFATCSSQLFLPAAAHPGNLLAPNITAHACGVSWIDGREIGPDVANRRWTTGLVLLSELRSTFDQLKHRQSRLDRLADDPPRVLDIGPGEQPIIIGCDHDFQHAMELGLDSVYAYITAVLQERATSAAHLLER